MTINELKTIATHHAYDSGDSGIMARALLTYMESLDEASKQVKNPGSFKTRGWVNALTYIKARIGLNFRHSHQ